MNNKKGINKNVILIVDLVVFLLFAAGLYYYSCPAMNLHSVGCWAYLGTLLFAFCLLLSLTMGGFTVFKIKKNSFEMKMTKFEQVLE